MTLVPGRVRIALPAWLAVIGALAIVGRPPAAAAQSPATRLDPDTAIERRLDRGEEHRYGVTLAAGEHARVRVEQRGIDVVVRVYDGGRQLLAEINDDVRPAGVEEVDIVARGGGVYEVAVAAAGAAEPGAYMARLTAAGPASAGDRALSDARTLRARASGLEAEARFDAARGLLEQALATTENVRGSNDVLTAGVLAQLGGVYRELPDDRRSEAAFQRAIAIFDAALTPDHPAAATARSGLALLLEKMGQRARSEALLRQATDALDRSLGTDNRWYVGALMTRAALQRDGGELDAAEATLQRAMTILERIGESDSRAYAAALNNLGDNFRLRGNITRAGELFQRALDTATIAVGADHYFTAIVLQNLGVVARERKEYAAAEAYYARVLAIRERVVGPNHPDVAQVLNNMATVARARGDLARSLDLHLRALSIWEHAGGPFQDATLLSAGNIARTYAAAGDVRNAIAYQRRADAILEKQLALNLAIGSERQKLLFVNAIRERTDRTISLHLREAPDDPEAAALAALVLLQRKGRVQDAMADTLAAVRQRSANEADALLVEQLKTTTAELARVALTAANPADADERQVAMQALEARKERFEAALAESSAEFRAETRAVTLAAVQAAIPDGAALLEFAVFRPFDPRAERNAEAYGPPHYAAYVVRGQLAPRGFDLGPAAPIDEAVDAFRAALRDPRRADVKTRARTLDSLVLAPVRGAFGGLARLLVSPDGALNLVPFEALVDEQERYLIERHAVSYLTSGRDLLRMQVNRASRSGAAIFADPVFGEPAAAVPAGAAPRVTASARRSVTTGRERSSVYFAPLAATAEEATAIKSLFPEATLFTGQRAQKAFLQQVQAPRILHIASHGFFLQDAAATAENPLLRSGLALAGANLPHDSEEDGILTALEASALDLWGTHLVTLSACDTGVGEVRNGEGVYGLRRAFVLAGTETLVMSLWPVSDAIARETMVAYYTGLRAGVGRGDALRQSKLAMLKRPARQHPFYWASFIQSGEWTPLTEPAPSR